MAAFHFVAALALASFGARLIQLGIWLMNPPPANRISAHRRSERLFVVRALEAGRAALKQEGE